MPPLTSASAPRRTYRSPLRERQARETRRRMLVAASTEFARGGYAATPMRAIARAAHVSVATLELAFGSKPQLLQAAITFSIRGDADPTPMLQRPWARRAEEARSAAELLAISAGVLVDGQRRSAGLIVAAFEAAHQDAALSALAGRLRAQRAETATWLVDRLLARARLRPELTREQAIDTVWLLMDPHSFQSLTRDRGWTGRRYEAWFSDSVHRLLLPDGSSTTT